jgi:hypothetical protein
MAPGDVLLHDILLLHGSKAARGNALRRVVYFEFRTAHVEFAHGPHTQDYIPLKQQILCACIDARRRVEPDEQAYRYHPAAPFDRFPRGQPDTYRVPHAAFWRTRRDAGVR